MRKSSLLIATVAWTVAVAPRGVLAAPEYASYFSLGTQMYSGEAEKSLTGASGYLIRFHAEKRKRVFRPVLTAELQYAKGEASLEGGEEPAFTLYGAGFLPGFNLFMTASAIFQPYIGFSPVLGWGLMKMASPPEDVDENTQSLVFGYEVRAGLDWRPSGKEEGAPVRIESALYSASGGLGGVSGLQLTGFRFSLGLGF